MVEEKFGLTIKNLTVEEIKEVCEKLREIEQRHPEETLFILIRNAGSKSVEETVEFIKKVFPEKRRG